jgi:hypothetical protein
MMAHIQQSMPANNEQDRKSSLKYIGLISLVPVVIALLLISAFPFYYLTIAEQYSIKAKQLSVQPDVQKDRKKVLLQQLEGLSAQEKYLLLHYVVFGKSVRDSGNDGKKVN